MKQILLSLVFLCWPVIAADKQPGDIVVECKANDKKCVDKLRGQLTLSFNDDQSVTIKGWGKPALEKNKHIDSTGYNCDQPCFHTETECDKLHPECPYLWGLKSKPLTTRWIPFFIHADNSLEYEECLSNAQSRGVDATVCVKGKEERIELGLRSDGVVVWR